MLVCKYAKKTLLELGFICYMGISPRVQAVSSEARSKSLTASEKFLLLLHLIGYNVYKRHICCMPICEYVKKTLFGTGFYRARSKSLTASEKFL
jgi:hypothetical protein